MEFFSSLEFWDCSVDVKTGSDTLSFGKLFKKCGDEVAVRKGKAERWRDEMSPGESVKEAAESDLGRDSSASAQRRTSEKEEKMPTGI